MAYNYFEKRFGKRYINYMGKDILTVNHMIFNAYKHLFEKTRNINTSDILIIDNNIPYLYKLRTDITIKEMLLTQKNRLLYQYLNNYYKQILDMEIKECATCSICFDKRDRMSIMYLILMDNHLIEMSRDGKNEGFLPEGITNYIESKYGQLNNHYGLIKSGELKVWRK